MEIRRVLPEDYVYEGLELIVVALFFGLGVTMFWEYWIIQ